MKFKFGGNQARSTDSQARKFWPAVAVVQRFLVLYGYQNLLGTVDGKFGTSTTKAVIQFQRDQNLKIKDGIVGSATWYALSYPPLSSNRTESYAKAITQS